MDPGWLQELQLLCGVPWEMVPLQCPAWLAWLRFFSPKKGKNTSTVVLSSIGAVAAAWQTSLVAPTAPRKMCLLGLRASLGADPQPGDELGAGWWCPAVSLCRGHGQPPPELLGSSS